MTPVKRIRIDLAYRGTDFSGWGIQPTLRTVQGTLEAALAKVLRLELVRVSVAGRTDAGVHARRQVTHADVPLAAWEATPGRSSRSPGIALRDRLNAVLPRDVVVHRVVEAPDGFDARFSALARRYSYRIADCMEARDPLRADQAYWMKSELDVAAMHEAGNSLVGLRDFAAFCKPKPRATTVRELLELTWVRPEDGPDAGLVVATVRADAFCHNMVRALVGASIAVGLGRHDPGWPMRVLVDKERIPAVVVVPAHGLTLEDVTYPSDDQLGLRAEKIRARRMDEEVDQPR